MPTPKTSFYLTNGTKLVDLYPLESNGPSSIGTAGGPNQSIPNEIIDIDYTDGVITVFGDLTERLVALSARTVAGSAASNIVVCQSQSEFDSLIANGLAVGMVIDVPRTAGELAAVPPTPPLVPNRTRVTAIDNNTRAIGLSAPLNTAINNRTVKFCYPFNIVDLDPLTPSPYVGDYAVSHTVFENNATKIYLAASAPLVTASFDIVDVIPGTNGSWIIQGITNASDVFYPGSTFTVTGNAFAPANTNYVVGSTVTSQSYDVEFVDATPNNPTTVTIKGNVGQFFIEGQQLKVNLNTTHNTGIRPLNGVHTILNVQAYNINDDTTAIVIATPITGVSGAANGKIQPAIPTTAITVNGLIVNGSQPEGLVNAGAPIQMSFAAPPAITPTAPRTFVISWRVAGNQTAVFAAGHEITIKNNNYFPFKRLIVDSVVYDPLAASGNPSLSGVTSIRTTIVEQTNNTPVIGTSGSIIYPSPAVPYGHIQYTVLTPATSLQLVGRGVTHYNSSTSWGQALQNNSIFHLENFANNTPPAAPLTGQLWYDTATPGLFIHQNGEWKTVVVEGAPVQGDLSLNNNAILGLEDLRTSDGLPTSTPVDLSQALNVGSADGRYVNNTGDYMTGQLSMKGLGPFDSLNKIINLADTVIPAGTTINTLTPSGTDALNVRTADARYVNVDGDTMIGALNMGANWINNLRDPSAAQDAATKSYVDSLTSGIVWLQSIADSNLFDDSLSSPPALSDSSLLFYRAYYVRPLKFDVIGVNHATRTWVVNGDRTSFILPGQKFIVKNNSHAPSNGTYTVQSTSFTGGNTQIVVVEAMSADVTISGFIYHAAGAWNNLEGRVVTWDGTRWVDVLNRPVQTGDRFGVFFEVDNDEVGVPVPGGSFAVGSALGTATKSAAGKIVTVNSVNSNYIVDWGTGAGAAFPPQTPVEPDAVSVLGANSPHYGHSYTFRGTWGAGNYSAEYRWIEFAGPSMIIDGAGLRYTGNVLNVGQGIGISVAANTVGLNLTYMNANYMRRDGSTSFTNHISMGNFRLINVANPTAGMDAVNRQFLEQNFVSSAGLSSMTGNLNMGSFSITNLATPTANTDAANKAYVDTKVAKSGDTMTGALVMSNASGLAQIDMGSTNKIINLADPTNNRDAVNLQTADGRYVRKIGDTMTGPLVLPADPTQNMQAANKRYVDTVAANTITTVQSATIDGGGF